jgi:diaminopimelate decarboxylase
MLTNQEYAYRGGVLHCEGTSLADIAVAHGTPAYIYSKAAIERSYRAYERALCGVPHRVCYAVKANSNLAVLQLLVQLGAGFDIVSGGELFRVLRAGAAADSVVFSGVGKTEEEIRYALDEGIHSFNCESEAELNLLSRLATKASRRVSIALRVNPDVDAITHPYISTGLKEHKFGTDISEVEKLYEKAMDLPGLMPDGVSCHIGSQLLDYSPILESAGKVLALIERLRERGIPIRHLDIGGGLGVRYHAGDRSPNVNKFIEALRKKLEGRNLFLFLEPGRSIVAEAGVLLTRVLLVKKNGEKTFVVVDAGMNDLVRPTLYQAHHHIAPVREKQNSPAAAVDVVGPVCETGDFLARGRQMEIPEPGDLLVLQTAGAYGFVLSSNYNSRPRVPELLVSGSDVHVVRRRETLDDLIRGEFLIQSWSGASRDVADKADQKHE